MVVAHCEIHHGTDDHFSIDRHRTLLDGMHSEDATLRRIQNRRAEERAIDPAIGNGEDTAGEILEIDSSFLGFRRVIENILLHLREALAITVTQHGNDEPLLGADGYSDVVEMIFDDVRPVNPGIDGGHVLECLHHRFHKEGHEAQFHAVLGDEVFLHRLTKLHHLSHIDFIKGRQNCRSLLGIDEMRCDLAT